MVEPLAVKDSKDKTPEMLPHEEEELLRASELLVVGEILPCLSSPVRMDMIESALAGTVSEVGGKKRHIRITEPARIQHLGSLRKLGLIGDDERPTALASVFSRFRPLFDSLAPFQDHRTSQKRFDILTKLFIAEKDGIKGVSLSLLAKHCGLSDSSLFKHLSALREAGLVQSETEEWGAPYGLTSAGKTLTSLVARSVEDVRMLMIRTVSSLGAPRSVVFPTTIHDKTHLLSFDGRRIRLETVETLSHAMRSGRVFDITGSSIQATPVESKPLTRVRPRTPDLSRVHPPQSVPSTPSYVLSTPSYVFPAQLLSGRLHVQRRSPSVAKERTIRRSIHQQGFVGRRMGAVSGRRPKRQVRRLT